MIYLSDNIFAGLETGIAPLVKALLEIDLPTYESCQGHIKPKKKDSFPNVYLDASSSLFKPDKFIRFSEVLAVWNLKRREKWQWIVAPLILRRGRGKRVLLRLRPFESNKERDPQILACLRKDVLDLAEFIMQVSTKGEQ